MSDNETSFTKHKPKEKVNSHKQKKELCQLAKNNPNFIQQELANKFGEQALARWFDLALENNITITGLILQEKAKQIVVALEIEKFNAFDGWLQ
ncbi:31204_t:CDS:2, partial [Racocetra persica]